MYQPTVDRYFTLCTMYLSPMCAPFETRNEGHTHNQNQVLDKPFDGPAHRYALTDN